MMIRRESHSLVADGSVASIFFEVSHGGIRMMPMIYAMVITILRPFTRRDEAFSVSDARSLHDSLLTEFACL